MEDLVRWLSACLDEDQRIVQEANTSPEMVTGIPRSYAQAPVAVHIATFADPARVLREIDSKRRQVEWCVEVIGPRDLSRYEEIGSLKDDPDALAVTLAVETLRLLAAVYADREGYKDSWRPS